MHFVVLFFRRGHRRSRHRLGKQRKIFLCVFLLLNYTGRLQPAKITRRTQQQQSLALSSLSAPAKLTAASIIHLEMQQLKKFSRPECALQKWRRLSQLLRSCFNFSLEFIVALQISVLTGDTRVIYLLKNMHKLTVNS
jgi:hypothetical protein